MVHILSRERVGSRDKPSPRVGGLHHSKICVAPGTDRPNNRGSLADTGNAASGHGQARKTGLDPGKLPTLALPISPGLAVVGSKATHGHCTTDPEKDSHGNHLGGLAATCGCNCLISSSTSASVSGCQDLLKSKWEHEHDNHRSRFDCMTQVDSASYDQPSAGAST